MKSIYYILLSSFIVSVCSNWIDAPPDMNCTSALGRCTDITHKTWESPISYTSDTACDVLKKLGVQQMLFYGDSYMRHIFAAMTASFSGDETLYVKYMHKKWFEDAYKCSFCSGVVGSLHNTPSADKSSRIFRKPSLFTSGGIKTGSAVVFLSYGNHGLGKDEIYKPPRTCRNPSVCRYGVNNASVYMEYIRPICKVLTKRKVRVYWVSTHYRLKYYYLDEVPEQVEQFNIDMRRYIESGKCTPTTGYIDVYNMTKSLALSYPGDALQLTPDKVHWGYKVNLIKLQILLNTIANSSV